MDCLPDCYAMKTVSGPNARSISTMDGGVFRTEKAAKENLINFNTTKNQSIGNLELSNSIKEISMDCFRFPKRNKPESRWSKFNVKCGNSSIGKQLKFVQQAAWKGIKNRKQKT